MDRKIKYIVIDVDGTMTDGGIYYDNNGNELKKFCTKDAAGFFAARQAGITLIVLTGRECPAIVSRMRELKVDILAQNIRDKEAYLRTFMQEHDIAKEELAYIGDDLNDLAPMRLVGFRACPADSCEEVKAMANYVSGVQGGHGAVRDVIEHLLRASGEWETAISCVYGVGV